MIEMSNSEYNELLNDLYAKVEAGEMAPDPREPHDVPDDYIPPSSNC